MLFSAITSWFWAEPGLPCGVLPPADMRIVLTACWAGAVLELLLLELLLDELDELADCGGGHGGTATVWTSVPRGTTIVVEPAGGFAVFDAVPTPLDGCPPVDDFSAPGVGHGGMLISMSLRCLARMTVRTPGVCRADAIGSVEDELLLELELPPHALSATADAATTRSPSPVRATDLLLPAISFPSTRRWSSRHAYPGAP
ncbi:MAG TPA: hypothetical protein VJT75_05060 [Thermoleophilaceae bacterium]|nr:hypothetical protein [Thermoleophilaceae bacterium]